MNEEKLKLKKSFMLFARFEFRLLVNQTRVSTLLHTHVCVMLTERGNDIIHTAMPYVTASAGNVSRDVRLNIMTPLC